MELIITLVIFLVGLMIGYFRGVVSGYHTKVREEDKSTLFNVMVYKEGESYIFYDMETNSFIAQNNDYHKGVEIVQEEFPDKKLVITLGDQTQ